jgi:hypothetical protein
MSEKHHGILMSDPMIRAYMAKMKGQTRRTRGLDFINGNPDGYDFVGMSELADGYHFHFINKAKTRHEYEKVPYGRPGDRLRFRETWRPDDFAPDDVTHTIYHADVPLDVLADTKGVIKWRPSLLIPNARTRFTPKLLSVRCERLQEISEADAIAEGVIPYVKTRYDWWDGWDHRLGRRTHAMAPKASFPEPPEWMTDAITVEGWEGYNQTAKEGFKILWESINGAGSWDLNPFVGIYEFERFTP